MLLNSSSKVAFNLKSHGCERLMISDINLNCYAIVMHFRCQMYDVNRSTCAINKTCSKNFYLFTLFKP